MKIIAVSMMSNGTIGHGPIEVTGTRDEFIEETLAAGGNVRVCDVESTAGELGGGCLDHEEYRFNAETDGGEWTPLPEGWDRFAIGYAGG